MTWFIDFMAPLKRVQSHWTLRCALGTAISGLAVLTLDQWASAVAHRYPFFCLYPPILVSAWLGRAAGGSSATVMGALAIDGLWIGETATDYIALVIFAVTGVVISVVQGRLHRTQDDLRASLAREADANRLKDEFLANLSHELRTPLNIILGYSRLLTLRPCADVCADAPHLNRSVEIIQRNAMAQMRIIEDLLDIQRILSGRLAMEYRSFDLEDLGRGVMDSLLPLAQTKGLHVHTSIPPVVIECDGARIQQVLWNLLANAIKFTPEGGCVSLSVTRENGEVRLVVEDSGEGIPIHFLPHVFERFRQLDMSTTRRHDGMGLGLAIAKHVIDAHGGSITAASPGEGQGATFTVRLPVTRPGA
jgi:signal transduction histidine kinase